MTKHKKGYMFVLEAVDFNRTGFTHKALFIY